MRRLLLNLLAGAVIAAGGSMMMTPVPVAADDGEACCFSPQAGCCGDQCKIDTDGSCETCEGFWDCLFF